MMLDVSAAQAGRGTAYGTPVPLRAVPLRTKARPLQVPMMDRKHWYYMATADITGYEVSTDPDQCFIHMKKVAEPVAVWWPIKYIDEQYAKAMFCPVLFRDETDMEALVG